jgi:hypothetical protein
MMEPIKIKSEEEILSELSEIIHRHLRRYIRKNTRPCPLNCEYASVVRKGVTGCTRCDSSNPEVCRQTAYFSPISTKDEVVREFRLDLRDPKILQHDYRDVLTLFWVLGKFEDGKIDEEFISLVEKRVRKD